MAVNRTLSVQEKLYTVDDVWAIECDPAYANRKFYLIDGELHEDDVPGRPHGRLAVKLSRWLDEFAEDHELGEATVEVGYYPADARYTLLMPDVAFMRHESLPQPPPQAYVPAMPDLAVEILSPGDTLAEARRKARVYLENGTALVWLVQPAARSVEVCRLLDGAQLQVETCDEGRHLSGEDILPGFTLEVSKIFAVLRD